MPRIVEDIYTLTPMQLGILYHTLNDPTGKAYIQQGRCVLRGLLDVNRLSGAWRRTIARHAALRTSFEWAGVRHPVQVVKNDAELNVRYLDWSGIDSANRQQMLEESLARELTVPFDLRHAPLLRVTIIRFSEQEHVIIWTYHHLILDAWGEANVLRDVILLYNGPSRVLPQPGLFRNYVRYLKSIDESESLAFWRKYLTGFVPETRVCARTDGHETALFSMTKEVEGRVRKFAGSAGVTVHAAMLSVWALFLSGWTKRQDLVFGVTVSGRSLEVPGSFDAAGVFFNTVPFRFQVNPGEPFGEMVRRIHEQRAAIIPHELTSLAAVRDAAGVPGEAQLFDSVSVYLNNDFLAIAEAHGDCEIIDLRYSSNPDYALTFRVSERSPMIMELLHSVTIMSSGLATEVLNRIHNALESGINNDGVSVQSLLQMFEVAEPRVSRPRGLQATRPRTMATYAGSRSQSAQ